MKTLLITGILILSMGIMGGYSWAAANSVQKQLPVRSTSYCNVHGGRSLACVLNGKAGGVCFMGVCNETP